MSLAARIMQVDGGGQAALLRARLDARQVGLRQGEGNLDRLDLGDGDQRRGAVPLTDTRLPGWSRIGPVLPFTGERIWVNSRLRRAASAVALASR